MKKILLIGSLVIAAVLGILIFSAMYEPKVDTAYVVTPTPEVVTPEPTPSPTPEIEILEDTELENILYLEFYGLLSIMTTSQYNYVMYSTTEFYSAMFQANLRNYSFDHFKQKNDDLLYSRFSFANDDETMVPFNKFKEAFTDDDQEYKLIVDTASIEVGSSSYNFNTTLYENDVNIASFAFTVNKNSLEIKIQ